MFIRPALTRQKLWQIVNRICNLLHSESIFTFEKIKTWRHSANTDPVQALAYIADELKALRVETLKDFELKTVNNEKERNKNNGF